MYSFFSYKKQILLFVKILVFLSTSKIESASDYANISKDYAKEIGEYEALNQHATESDLGNILYPLENLRSIVSVIKIPTDGFSQEELSLLDQKPTLPKKVKVLENKDSLVNFKIALKYYLFWTEFNNSKIKPILIKNENSQSLRLSSSAIVTAENLLQGYYLEIRKKEDYSEAKDLLLKLKDNTSSTAFINQLLSKKLNFTN
jgi:hypothetical protein